MAMLVGQGVMPHRAGSPSTSPKAATAASIATDLMPRV